MSTLMLQILGSIAEFERALIKNRQAEGIAIAKAKGKFKGGKKKLPDCKAKEMTRLLAAKMITPKEAMKQYDISRASVYNYLNQYDNYLEQFGNYLDQFDSYLETKQPREISKD